MATSPNPFAHLSRNLSTSRVGGEAVAKNLANRVAEDRRRANVGQPPTPPASDTSASSRAAPAPAPASQAPSASYSFAALSRSRAISPADATKQSASIGPSQPPAPVVDAAKPPSLSSLSRRSGVLASGVTAAPRKTPNVAAAPAALTRAPASAPSPAPAKKLGRFTVLSDAEMDIDDDGMSDEPEAPAIVGPTHRDAVSYSDEQLAVINCDDQLIVADAFAGSGKTTTAIGYAKRRPNERMIYLCLNAENAKEAKQRFPSNVVPMTTHSMAWSKTPQFVRNRVTKIWKPLVLQDQMGLQKARDAASTLRVLADFFNSADTDITEKHAKQVAYERDLNAAEVGNAVAFARLAWKRMQDQNDKMQMPHDAYLKMFAMKAPQLSEYGCIIFDEAQDANPVTLQIVRGQTRSRLLCIGDRHQSIYQFRGSVNAMQILSAGATRFHLAQTWRFGPEIAKLANLVLGELKGEKVKIQGMGQDHAWDGRKVTTLARTNAELFRLAAERRGEGVHWVGGLTKNGEDNYRLEGVMDAYHLYARDRSKIKNTLMRNKFASWDEYVTYGEDASDGEIRVLTKVVEEFGHDIPQLVTDIRANAVDLSADADLCLTTGHKSKGLEWDFVRISNDFEVLEEAEDVLANHLGADIPEQDINLLYVMLTRARKGITPTDEMIKWIANLDQHRSNREAAQIRYQTQLNEQREALERLRA